MFSVKGKTAIVTGGSSGLGFDITLRLLQGGANVMIASFSDLERDTAMPLLEEQGFKDRAAFCLTNVTDEKQMEHLVAYTAETLPHGITQRSMTSQKRISKKSFR